MGVNKDLPHVYVLPEDDANRQLVNGFLLQVDPAKQRQVQVLAVAGGWTKVLKRFLSGHVVGMTGNPNQFMVLLIDFDGRNDRLGEAKKTIPERLHERVFVLGVWTEPEMLRSDLERSYEQIGTQMAEDCRQGTDWTWQHPLLLHNAAEIDRLRTSVRPILFS